MTRGRPQSAERQAIQAALAAADEPLTAEQIATRSGVAVPAVRQHLSNICARGDAHRVAWRCGRRTFAAGPSPHAAASFMPVRPSTVDGIYEGRELLPYTGRPGAMQAFDLPSLVNGVRVARRRPQLVSTEASPWAL